MRVPSMLRVGAASLVLVAWLAVLRGLYLLPVSRRPELDLEAGPAFGINVEVYLPAMALTVLLLVLLPVGVASPGLGSVAAMLAASIVATFGLWVLTRQALLDYRPGLDDHLLVAVLLSGAGVTLAVASVPRLAAGLTARS